MKQIKMACVLMVAVLCLLRANASSLLITNDTAIGPFNLIYDGSDIVVSNCVLTIDGLHGFNSLLVESNGVLTHSFFPSGSSNFMFSVTNELLVLSLSNSAALDESNIVGAVTVTDLSGTNAYVLGADYGETNLPDGAAEIYMLPGSSISNGASVLVDYQWEEAVHAGLDLIISNNATIAMGSGINAGGLGYGSRAGPGFGTSSYGIYFEGAGGGSFGNGGVDPNVSWGPLMSGSGFVITSNWLGSGGGIGYGGPGANGGGAIVLNVGGTLELDGALDADGAGATNTFAGGGAGGGIFIEATTIIGAGSVHSDGGAGDFDLSGAGGGGGGGGRVVFECLTNEYTGVMSAYGGPGSEGGGAGAVLTQVAGQLGQLVVDNGGQAGPALSPLLALTNSSIRVANGAILAASISSISGDLTVGSNAMVIGGTIFPWVLSVGGNMDIQPGGAFSLDGQGYGPAQGPGGGITSSSLGGGAGHGGYGVNVASPGYSRGLVYDSQFTPTNAGSGGNSFYPAFGGTGGAGGAGGGALLLSVGGTLQVDGSLSANGSSGTNGGGGGSGGSIYVTGCTALAGSGTISANGGGSVPNASGSGGGGGGGGRIAVQANASSFSGKMTAYGGGSVYAGGAGTIYTQFGNAEQLVIDNDGQTGTNTPIVSAPDAGLVVQNGAIVVFGSPSAYNSLLINSNGWMTEAPATTLNLVVSNNAIINAGGGFMGDALGDSNGNGNGAGGTGSILVSYYSISTCGGGGFGGNGGDAITNTAFGGMDKVDSSVNPVTAIPGSSGGGALFFLSTGPLLFSGGSGGGAIQLAVNGMLQLDGIISANGGNATELPQTGGGGSGGGIVLNVGELAGNGLISVNGGSGTEGLCGGGGGGRITIRCTTNGFDGSLTAYGGSGVNYGGAGTVFIQDGNDPGGRLLVGNLTNSGAGTFLENLSVGDLTIQSNTLCCLFYNNYGPYDSYLKSIDVQKNAILLISNTTPVSTSIEAQNVTIEAGGRISGDSAGGSVIANYPISRSFPNYQMGAGHGGEGGNGIVSYSTNFGGFYDDSANPTYPGIAGGSFLPYSIGGKGGGSISFFVKSELRVDGSLTVNGGNGSGVGGGGGSGGSVKIQCLTFSGTGIIAANGGNGVSGASGGGGGGLIAITSQTNLFSGIVTAYGGLGNGIGGAGIISWFGPNPSYPFILVDNEGNQGASTLLSANNSGIAGIDNVTIQNGGSGTLDTDVSTIQNLVINQLVIRSNSSLSMESSSLHVLGSAVVQRRQQNLRRWLLDKRFL